MKRTRGAGRSAGRGFTLIELLVVMAIIALLVSLLLPALNQAMIAVKVAATKHTIEGLEAGLEAFKMEFGIYPPSDTYHDNGFEPYGQAALVYYLMGPNYTGWGASAGGTMLNKGPFAATANVTKAIPPYFTPDHPGDISSIGTSTTAYPVLWDSFSPGKPILYFRFEPAGELNGTNSYDANTCPFVNPTSGGGSLDPKASNSFYSQTQFEALVHPVVSGTVRKWVREDYILVAPGADRYYGPINIDVNTGAVTPYDPGSFPTQSTANYLCDDICNFSH